MNLSRLLAACLPFLFLLCALVSADEVELTNGAVIEGEIVEESDARVVIRAKGGKLVFPRRLVKRVTKKAADKKPKKSAPSQAKPKRSAKPAASKDDDARYGPENLWAEWRGQVSVGTAYEFALGYHRLPAKLRKPVETLRTLVGAGEYSISPGSGVLPKIKSREMVWPTRSVLTVTRMSVKEIQYKRRRGGAGYLQKRGSDASWEGRAIRVPKDHKRDTLRISGRDFPCSVSTKKRGDKTVKTWYSIRGGTYGFPPPRVPLRVEWNGHLVINLVKVSPPPKGISLPSMPDWSVGDLLVWEERGKKIERRVKAISPGMVVGGATSYFYYDAKNRPGRNTFRFLRRETRTLGPRTFRCVVLKVRKGQQEVITVDEGGARVFPGLVELVREGKTILKLVDVRPVE